MRNLRTQEDIMATWQGDPDKPVVSICCITYNHEPYIEDALEGFLIQETDFPFEILIHDDASTDRTADIIREYEAKYPKIIKPVYQTENQKSMGVRVNAYFNFPRIKGKYVAFCEGDDYWKVSDKLALQANELNKNKNVDFSIHQTELINISTNERRIICQHGSEKSHIPLGKVFETRNQFAATSSYLIRTKALNKLPHWFVTGPLPYGDFFIEAIAGEKGFSYLPKVMSVYRHGVPGSHTKKLNKLNVDELVSNYEITIKSLMLLNDIPHIKESHVKAKISIVSMNYVKRLIRSGCYRPVPEILSNVVYVTSWYDKVILFVGKKKLGFNFLRLIARLSK